MVSEKTARINSIKLSKTSVSYTGKAKKAKVRVTDIAGKTLVAGRDYSVKYSKGRTECGTYKVVVTLVGLYKGSKTLKFKVVPAKVSGIQQESKNGIFIKWNKVKGANGYEAWALNKEKGKFQFLSDVKKPNTGNAKATFSMNFKIRA